MHPDHLDETTLQELIHGELSESEDARAREHLKGCAACTGRLEEAGEEERRVATLLSQLDTPPPLAEVGRVVAAASKRPPFASDRRRLWNRLAAGVVLALGIGGVAYAIPGSPVREWLDEVIPKVFGWNPGTRAPETAPPAAALGGIAVIPGPTFVISFLGTSEGSVRVSLVEGEVVTVRAPSGSASYESGHDRLVIHARGTSVAFEIDLPRSAPHVEIQVDGERIFLKEGDRTEPALPPPSGVLRLPPRAK